MNINNNRRLLSYVPLSLKPSLFKVKRVKRIWFILRDLSAISNVIGGSLSPGFPSLEPAVHEGFISFPQSGHGEPLSGENKGLGSIFQMKYINF